MGPSPNLDEDIYKDNVKKVRWLEEEEQNTGMVKGILWYIEHLNKMELVNLRTGQIEGAGGGKNRSSLQTLEALLYSKRFRYSYSRPRTLNEGL